MRGAQSGWFLVKIIVPLSAAVAVLQWTGILALIGRVLAPFMGLFGLPGEAAVAIVSGYLAGVYGGVAAASVLPLTKVQMTVLALMVLVAHNLVIESTIQSRSGVSGLKVSTVRIATAFLLGALLWQTLRFGAAASAPASTLAPASDETVLSFARTWAIGTTWLVFKIFLIVSALMVATEIMRAYGVFEALVRPLRPIMRLLGLSERVSFLWLTGTFLGVSYGAGLIIQEARQPGRFEPGDLRDLHVSIGISHSLLEDTLLFVALGASPFWILVPRPLASAAAVRAVRRLAPAERDPATRVEALP